MSKCAKVGRSRLVRHVALIIIGWLAAPAAAQSPFADERPALYPTRPMTRLELNKRQSLHQFALGLLCEREDRLLEALRAYEEAARLDPEAPAVFKAQVPILVALDRPKAAQDALRKVVTLDPADHEAWFLAARVHKSLAEYAEARNCLERGLKAPGMAEVPEIAQQMYLELGQLHETAEDFAGAVTAYQAAAKILDHPDTLTDHGPFQRETILARSADTHERIGQLYSKLKKFDEAIAEYTKAQTQNPQRAGRLNLHLAQLCLEQQKLAEALPFLDAYLRLQPLGLEAYELKVDALRRLGQSAAIVPWLEKASRADENNTGLKILLAQQYVAVQRHTDAAAILQNLAEHSPSADVYKNLFRLYKNQAGMTKALELLNKTLEKAKEKGPPGLAAQQARAMVAALDDDADISQEMVRAGMRQIDFKGDLKFDTVHLLAVLADRQKKLPEAEAFYRQSLKERRPGNEALLYSGLLRVLWKARKYQGILDVCDSGLRTAQATNHILFHHDRARALAALDRLDEALKAADQAVDLAGDNDRLAVRRLKVRLLVQAEKYDTAEAECQDMFKEFPQAGETLEVRYLLSLVYSAREQRDKAEQQLELILKADPENATANNDLGYMWADRGKNLPEAEAMIRRAIDADRRQRKLSRPGADEAGDNAAYIDSLGWVLFRRGRLDEARQELERAARLDDSDDPVIHDHLGDVYFRLERFDQARASWERALRLYQHEKRRKMDDRQRELERKLKTLP